MRNDTLEKFPDRNFINFETKLFLKKGGQIKILPPQKAVSRSVIFPSELAAYESLDDFTMY
jgi:hypothetical protein